MGDDDLVVVLGRAPVDGRELEGSLRDVCCGAVEGRTPDKDERDCMKRETLVSMGLCLPGALISNVNLDGAGSD